VRGGDNYVGIDVNRAARIAAAGHGGQVIVSDATRGLVEHALPEGVSFRDLGEHRLKDLNLAAQLTSFVGREREIAEARRLLGRARLLTLTGPGQAEWLDRCDLEHANLRAALRWAIEAGETKLAQEAAGRSGGSGSSAGTWPRPGPDSPPTPPRRPGRRAAGSAWTRPWPSPSRGAPEDPGSRAAPARG
jgi:hypothetical protein